MIYVGINNDMIALVETFQSGRAFYAVRLSNKNKQVINRLICFRPHKYADL